jgi:ABC-2 type transport system ATP-binding protein
VNRPEQASVAAFPEPSGNAARAALRVAGVSHRYGRREALKGVSLEVPQGRFTALIGVNGAGKTTLFNLVTGLFSRQSGTIEVCGHDVGSAPRAALARLGVVFQSRALDANLTVAQNLAYQGALHGMRWRRARDRANALLSRMGLAERKREPVRALSGGQARRVEIAAALLHGPRLLLCDEATVGLDVASRRDIVADLHALAADEGVGVLWATHLIEEILPGDPVYVLHRGEVLAAGTAAGIAGAGTLSDAFLRLTGGQGAAAAT